MYPNSSLSLIYCGSLVFSCCVFQDTMFISSLFSTLESSTNVAFASACFAVIESYDMANCARHICWIDSGLAAYLSWIVVAFLKAVSYPSILINFLSDSSSTSSLTSTCCLSFTGLRIFDLFSGNPVDRKTHFTLDSDKCRLGMII